MTDEEKIRAVTAKLTGEFYVGQQVRIRYAYTVPSVRGLEARIKKINKAGFLHLSAPLHSVGPWHKSNVEPA